MLLTQSLNKLRDKPNNRIIKLARSIINADLTMKELAKRVNIFDPSSKTSLIDTRAFIYGESGSGCYKNGKLSAVASTIFSVAQ